MPLEHYSKYKADFQEFVWLSPTSNQADADVVAGALDIIIAQTDYVDAKLKEEAHSLMLLNLQNQFSGNPVIFTPSRRLVKEGDVERVRQSKDGSVVAKNYYAHLFNDAFIYSARNIVTGRYKLHNVIDLKGAKLSKSGIAGVTHGFSLGSSKDDKEEHFRFANEEEFTVWFALIGDQISSLKAHKIGKRTSVITRSNVTLPGVDVAKLGVRGNCIYKFLLSELQFAEAMSLLNITVIQPLIDASKGAVLNASKVTSSNISGAEGEGLQLREGQSRNKDALFDGGSSSGGQSKYQVQAITEALQDADVQIFLRAAEGIALSLRDFVNALEVLCNSSSWNESIVVGSFFNSVSALALYNQFKAYAAGQQATLRILKTQIFLPFYKEAELFLSNTPGSFVDKIELPRKRVRHFLNFVVELQKLTAQSHLDFAPLGVSVEALNFMEAEVEELVRLKKNFEELLEIQSSLVSLKVMGTEPILQKLASMDRTIITQGDLKKVCRKKNKTFRFWLFNDYIIYGSALGGGKFSFNRALEISKCSVALHTSTSLKHAFEIFGAEKSFIVIAASQASQVEWVERISKAREDFVAATGGSLDKDQASEAASDKNAPLWVPDNGSDGCTVCKQSFTFWNRRHHCRKCGALVCSDHSKNKELLAHIHKSQKQKICDNCFLGKTVTPGPPQPDNQTVRVSVAVETAVPAAMSSPSAPPLQTSVSPTHTASSSEKKSPLPPPKPLKSGGSWIAPSSTTVGPPSSAAPPIPKKLDNSAMSSYQKAKADIPTSLPPPVPKLPPPETETITSPPPPVPSIPPPSLNAPTLPAPAVPKIIPPPVPTAPVVHPVALPPPKLPPPPTVAVEVVTEKPKGRVAPPPPPANTTAPPPPPVNISKPAVPAAASDIGDDGLRKYRKMLEMLPEGAVRQKMANDGFSGQDIDALVGGGGSQNSPAPLAARSAGLPPPPPPPSMAQPAPSAENCGEMPEHLRKYAKMKEMLPAGAVRQKMMADGFGPSDIDGFLAGTSLPHPSGVLANSGDAGSSLAKSLASAPTLKTVDRAPPPKKLSLLDEIQSGSKLKSVQKEDTRMKSPAIQGAGGLLGMLASEMSKRRFNMKVEHEDDDSDSSGFSSSDSDSDED